MSSELATVQDEQLPVFRGESYEEHVSTWVDVDRSMQGHLWMLGAVASSLKGKYGEEALGKFASDVGSSRSRVYEFAQTYDAWEKSDRSDFLSFRHHTLAARSADPPKALQVAEDEQLSTRELETFVKTGEIPERGKPKPKYEGLEELSYQEVQEHAAAHVAAEKEKEQLREQGLVMQPVPAEPEELVFEQPEEPRKPMDVHHSSESNEWYTPPEFVERVEHVLGAIDLDPCSNADKNIRAAHHFTAEDDGLSREWFGRVFMNPPYGTDTPHWMLKLQREYRAGRVSEAIVLVAARTETRWFRVLREHPRCFLSSRLKFSGHENSAPFPSAVFYLGDNLDAFVSGFTDIGDIYRAVNI